MGNSALSCKRAISPFHNSPRNHKIDTITIHCTAGQASVEALCSLFQTSGASCNYAIGSDGRICTIVDEADRSWCSSNPANDNRAVTIECSSDSFYPYAISASVWQSLVELCADICKRNGIKQLVWSTDKITRLAHLDGCNMTVHRDYANKSCPGDYIYGRMGQIAKEVNAKLDAGNTTQAFKAYQGQVNADGGLNCRTAPVCGAVLKTYLDGMVVTITQEKSGWGYTGEGWVCLDYITKIASAKDPATKEESIMDGKQVEKIVQEVLNRQNPTYNTLAEVPDYWRKDIQELVEKGIITGTGGGKLGLTHSDCKAAVIAKRIQEMM